MSNIYSNILLNTDNFSYFTLIKIDSDYNKDYSIKAIEFLNNNPTIDIIYSSYSKLDKTTALTYMYSFYKMLFKNDEEINEIPKYGIIYRKEIFNLFNLNEFMNFSKISEIYNYFLVNNMNIACFSEEIMYILK
jgi:hypothetical protein